MQPGASGPARLQLSPSLHDRATAQAVVFVVAWCLVVLTVQPWTAAEGRSTSADSGGLVKGAVLLLCLAVVAAPLRFTTRLRVAPFAVIYIGYGATYVVASLALDQPLDSTMRASRIALAVALPALAWPLFRRRPERMIYAHLVAYAGLAAVVVAGAVAFPARAFRETTGTGGDRLAGVLLPLMPPRVGEIGAVLVGLTFLTLAGRRLRWGWAVPLIVAGGALLALSRTRTPALALVTGVAVALLVSRRSRLGRRGLASAAALITLLVPLAPVMLAWLTRAQSTEQIASLSGRTTVWQHIVQAPTSIVELLLGRGLGEKKVLLRRGEGDINVMAIDNTWVGAYWETGLIGVAFVVLAVAVTLHQSVTAPTAYVRAGATFLVIFVLASSLSETGLSDISSQTLNLLVAAVAAHADHHRSVRDRLAAPEPDSGSGSVTAVGAQHLRPTTSDARRRR